MTKIVFILVAISQLSSAIPWGATQNGDFTYYDDAGYGACGSQINAASQDLVAVSYQWFVGGNPNNDPLCTQNVCVKVDYNGKSITVPVKDKCPSCNKGHLDLSKTAFQKLAPLSVGHVYGVTWSFVKCSGGGSGGCQQRVTVKSGDTCWQLSQTHGTPGGLDGIYRLNPGINCNLWVGQSVCVR